MNTNAPSLSSGIAAAVEPRQRATSIAPVLSVHAGNRKSMTLHRLRAMHADKEKIVMLTCYDASFARMLDDAGVEVLLVGDSLGMVLQGHDNTVPVSIDEMAYHTSCVARGATHAWIVADLPFGSYHESAGQAMCSAARLMQSGAHMVKLEGGGWTAEIVRFLVERGVPVCAHLGLTPQSVHALGGYRVQGRDEATAQALVRDAKQLADAGASMLVVELVPSDLANELTEALPIPVIGIGAGGGCSGQVLVLHDMLGISQGKRRFVRNFMDDADGSGSGIENAIRRYVSSVKNGSFPVEATHTY